MTTANWRKVKLAEICSFKYGQMPKREDLVEAGHPIFSGYRVVGYSTKYHYRDPEIIVVARGVGGTGDIKMSPPNCYLTNLSIATLIESPDVHKPFLFYRLAGTKLWDLRTGSAQAQITIERLRDYEVRLPPLPVQRKIASILSAYDELIGNNQRRIKTLEEMARSLYREWFVNFRFSGHEKVRMVESPLGPIPKGWEVRPVPECIDINPRVAAQRDSEKPFVPMGSLANDSMLIADIESRSGNSGAKFQNGDTLFARITPCLENGKTGFVQFLSDADSAACGSTEFIVLRSRTLTPEFVYLLARSEEFRGNAIKSMTGASGRQRVQEQCFDRFLVAQPPRPLLSRFSTIVAPSFRLIHKLHLQTQNLRRTRDLLLPRLLSGQVPLGGRVV